MRAILNQRTHTGVSVQTLHPTKFDHGTVLAQTPLPGYRIEDSDVHQSLSMKLQYEGAVLLRGVIINELFLPPLVPITHTEEEIHQITNGQGLAKAPKITKADSCINFATMTADNILAMKRISMVVWDDNLLHQLGHREHKRVIFHALKAFDPPLSEADNSRDLTPGVPFHFDNKTFPAPLVIPTKDGKLLCIDDCTIEGQRTGHGAAWISRLLERKTA